ncbi:hypothetical protein [Xanthomonas arboricola]|nr:hypothetical protein [Xanthomonas arboricola]
MLLNSIEYLVWDNAFIWQHLQKIAMLMDLSGSIAWGAGYLCS